MLIASIEELKKYIPTDVGQNLEKINSFLENAETREIIKILGGALYMELKAAYEIGFDASPEIDSGSTDLRNDKLEALLPYVQRPLAYFAYLDAVPIIDVVITNTGLGVVSNQNIAPASQNRVASFKKGIEKAAFDGVEALIQYLEENIADFDTWQSSTAYSLQKNHIITNAREFNKYVEIENSRLSYLKLLPTMFNVEQMEVAAAISKDLLDEIIEEQKDGDVTSENQKILDMLKPAVANMAMGRGIYLLANAIYAEGVMKNYVMFESQPAERGAIEEIKNSFQATGMAYLTRARGIILANIDDYQSYKDSDLYDETQTEVGPTYENEDINTTFTFGGGIC